MQNTNAVVKMDNALMRACYKMSVNEFRVILVALSKLPNDSKPIDQKQPYYITKEDFIQLGVAPNNVAREIRAGCGELLDRKIFIDTPVGVLGAHWVQNVLHFKSEAFEELKKQYPNSQYDEDFLHELRRQFYIYIIGTYKIKNLCTVSDGVCQHSCHTYLNQATKTSLALTRLDRRTGLRAVG